MADKIFSGDSSKKVSLANRLINKMESVRRINIEKKKMFLTPTLTPTSISRPCPGGATRVFVVRQFPDHYHHDLKSVQ
jgi:hypothetical protein